MVKTTDKVLKNFYFYTLLSLLLMLFLSGFANAESSEHFLTGDFSHGEKRFMEVSWDKKEMDKFGNSLKVTLSEAATKFETELLWVGEGKERHITYYRKEHLRNKCTSEWKFTFLPGENLILDKIENKMINPEGEITRDESYSITDSYLKYPQPLLHSFVIEVALRTMEFKKGNKKHFYVFLGPSSIYKMEVKVMGRETLNLPIGKKDVIRVNMRSLLEDVFGSFTARFLKYVIPGHVFWFDAEGNHPMLKYTGPMGRYLPVGVPLETHTIVNYEPGVK